MGHLLEVLGQGEAVGEAVEEARGEAVEVIREGEGEADQEGEEEGNQCLTVLELLRKKREF